MTSLGRSMAEATGPDLTIRRFWTGSVVLLGVLGLVAIVLPDITLDWMPGDIGDARFNRYVLEHLHLWMSGRVAHFWDAPFFFPYPLTTAFSDNHLGNGLVYSAFRWIGLDPEDSFRGWYLVGYIVNYVACAYALRKMGCSGLAAGAGSFLFTFGLPITSQEGHAQLIYRFGVPLAVMWLIRFSRQPRLVALVWVAFWTVWQFYCSIYIGTFLLMLLAAISFSILLWGNGKDRRRLPDRLRAYAHAWTAAPLASRAGFLAAVMFALAGLAVLAQPYLQVSRLYHFQRSWIEISAMLPRIASYLLSDNSLLWNFSWSSFDRLPMRQEHAMFVGIAPYLAVLSYVVVRRSSDDRVVSLFRVACTAIFVLVVLTLSYKDYSIYSIIAPLPGVNAIRAVTRIGTVLLFPVAVLLALAVDRVLDAKPGRAGAVWVTILLGVLCTENVAIRHGASKKSEWTARIARLEARLPSSLPPRPIVFVAASKAEPAFARELDGMLLAQARGWPTLNGYSGNMPHGHAFTGSCLDATHNLASGLNFTRRPDEDDLFRQIVVVDADHCAQQATSMVARVSEFSGPLAPAVMAKTSVSIEALKEEGGQRMVTVRVNNHSDALLPSVSLSNTPVRISAIYVEAGEVDREQIPRSSWTSRYDLLIDVPAGQSVAFDVPLSPPPAPGAYRIAVSMVQDGVAWFDDKGMPIAISAPFSAP